MAFVTRCWSQTRLKSESHTLGFGLGFSLLSSLRGVRLGRPLPLVDALVINAASRRINDKAAYACRHLHVTNGSRFSRTICNASRIDRREELETCGGTALCYSGHMVVGTLSQKSRLRNS